jgi:uncharacterized protein (TIGR00288 family)
MRAGQQPGVADREPTPQGQVAVFLDFENLVLGAGQGLPRQATPVPYEALSRLCQDYGNASVRRAYADWADRRFGRYQEDLAMNGVDLIQVGRFGGQAKNAADIQMAVDAMETLIVHPEVTVYVLVTGDSDFTPLVRRLREFGKWVVGLGADASASRRLVSVSSEYKYWTALVAEVDSAACSGVNLAFDTTVAEKLLVRASEEIPSDTPTASAIKGKMLALDPCFDEHDYGCDSFRDFLARFPGRVKQTGRSGNDITLTLISQRVSGLR